MDWIIIDSKKGLKDAIEKYELDPKKFWFVKASEVLKARNIPDKYTVFMYGDILVPGPVQLNAYYDNSVSFDEYSSKLFEYYNNASRLVYINELVFFSSQYDVSVVLFCSEDEEEFGYLSIFGDMMEQLYGINVITWKKFKKGKHSHHLKSLDRICNYSEKLRKEMFKRYDALGVRLPLHMFRRYTKKDLKALPKNIRKVMVQDIENHAHSFELDVR